MKIKKNDIVLIISGKDKGRKGKVIKASPKTNKIVVEGLNIIKKHVRPKKQGEKGQRIDLPAPLDISNVKLICPKCKSPVRITKKRICKKCQNQV
ncbi:MAG: 50S ribosomal protein L24 [Candidatus Portnoybacteria bacterium CG23_combo_of_CG06-09_8_20_14_all_37_13]|uniref:Large ribosomal subunit protein uL24 n=1 Tax=Candidatus Portnoybacteria bacterium CG23_combo_of_CG06-09_8_20_14_all_37_13 TaxID=1974819 RepID=A0A2G9YDS0_9BACT|nr:MAG: 50S ribosomal protein L24 [Candidatus Portnoybacteria bacterium CG23_combo_of_CG06-09_8_20_14_all_37_13]